MALIVSEQMHQRKKLKFQRDLKRTLSSFTSAGLKDNINKIFGPSTVRPTANHFLEMTLASKFGTGNALAEGGQGFLKATCIKVFNEFIRDGKATQYPEGAFYGGTYSTTDLWNASFLFNVDAALFSHIGKLDADDFLWADEISPYLFLDKATQAFGFIIVPLLPMTLAEFKEYGESQDLTDWDVKVEERFQERGYAQYQLLDFDTGPMEYISAVVVQFGTVDKLIQSLPDRDRHNVRSHSRQYSPGKTTIIKSHKRTTPLRLVASSGKLTDHVVYSVTDHAGDVRYIGEGKRDRPKHVNSGASHNWKINEHYFTKGEMIVEIAHEGLTKSEALAMEQMLIKKSSGTGLWNVKDYEPFTNDTDRSMSVQDIQDYFDL